MVRNRIKRECLKCGKAFETVPSVIASGKGKFCSKHCSATYPRLASEKLRQQARINVIKAHEAMRGNVPWNKKDKINLICTFCHKEYKVHECEFKRNPIIHFCSRECANHYKSTITGTNHPLWKRQLRKCEWCDNEVWVKPAKLVEFRFCSRQCLGSWVRSHCHSPTKPELLIKNTLEKLSIPFEIEYRVGRYSCDFAIISKNLIIEVDGDYWHSSTKRKTLDKTKDAHLNSLGWTVIRLKESDIYHDLPKCLLKISKHYKLLSI
jgi:very-short-patch-repair endonuclease